MRATLILLFVALGFQASAETRAICSVTGTHFLDGAELTEQSDLVDTLYIQYNEETLSLSDGTPQSCSKLFLAMERVVLYIPDTLSLLKTAY